MKDLKSELSGNFENVILALMTPLIEFDAEQLRYAMAVSWNDIVSSKIRVQREIIFLQTLKNFLLTFHSTGYPSSSGWYSGLLPWSTGVAWTLPRSTYDMFAVPPQAPEATVPSAQWKGVLFVPFARTSKRQTCTFSVDGLSALNGLPLALWLLPRVLSDTIYVSLKTVLFSCARMVSASEL